MNLFKQFVFNNLFYGTGIFIRVYPSGSIFDISIYLDINWKYREAVVGDFDNLLISFLFIV